MVIFFLEHLGPRWAPLWPSNSSGMFAATLRMIVSRYRRISWRVRALWPLARRSRVAAGRKPTAPAGSPQSLHSPPLPPKPFVRKRGIRRFLEAPRSFNRSRTPLQVIRRRARATPASDIGPQSSPELPQTL